ncbi:MAG: hypothetical protein RL238_2211 [Actinomycetota bacterium]
MTVDKNHRVRRVGAFLIVLLPLLLAGCSESWPLAATTSDGNTELLLPSCATKPVVGVRVFDEATLKVIWEIRAPEPGTAARSFVIGDQAPGFVTVTSLADPLDPDATYEATAIFGGEAGPTSDVRFRLPDLEAGSLWFDSQRGTQAEFESSAENSGLCGVSESFKRIFFTKFGIGCAVALIALAGFAYWRVSRRRPA